MENIIENKTASKPRLTVFDVAKCLGMFIVIFAHVNLSHDLLVIFYSFHMPLFFALSGLFFNRSKYTFGQFVKNRFLKLICPYLFFYALILLAVLGKSLLTDGFSLEVVKTFKEPFIQMFIAQNSSKVICAPLWFVPCLFIVEVLYFFIAKLKKYFIALVCAILVVLGWVLETYFTNVTQYLPWSIDSALFALGFYAIGNLLSSQIKALVQKIVEHKYKILISLGIAIVSFACMIPLAFLNDKVSLGSKILNNGFLFYATGLLGTIGVVALAIVFEKVKFFSYVGKNTFCLMAVHYFVYLTLKQITIAVGFAQYSDTNFLHTLILSIITFGVSMVCVLVYNYFKDLIFNKKKPKVDTSETTNQ